MTEETRAKSTRRPPRRRRPQASTPQDGPEVKDGEGLSERPPRRGPSRRSGGSRRSSRSNRSDSSRRSPDEASSRGSRRGSGGPRRSRDSANGRRRRPGGRREGIRDATANRLANSGRSRRGGRYGGPRPRKGLEILKMLQQQVSIDPYERFTLETTPQETSMRVMDVITPIGRGQRALIVSPPKAGKTTLLTQVANAIAQNHPEVKVYALLVDERPEEVTHFKRSTKATVYAASSDMATGEHIDTAEECMNTVVEPVLAGEDVVLLLDSITRLARAYNTIQGGSGRTLSGGLDANTMLAPRQIFGAARKIEDGGSLTILGTALVDTGSRMDEVIFQEFKGTGNTELVLSRDLFEKRIFPCVDISKSGTRKEEKLYPEKLVSRIYNLRRLTAQYPPDKAMLGILKLMQRHTTNEDLLLNGLAGLE